MVKQATIRDQIFIDGHQVSCRFNDGQVYHGFLHLFDIDSSSVKMFFCHNHPTERHGSRSPRMFGCQNSWVFRYYLEKDQFSEDVVELASLERVKLKSCQIDKSILEFLEYYGYEKITKLFYYAAKPYEFFDNVAVEKDGVVKLTGKVQDLTGEVREKNVSIKFSRLIKRLYDVLKLNQEVNLDFNIQDSDVEAINNRFVAWSNNDTFELEFYSGEDILLGYTQNKYSNSNKEGSLWKSCMTDKHEFLELYTQNPEQISLACLVSESGIEARCLVWTIDDKVFFDRIYSTREWYVSFLMTKLKELGYEDIFHQLQNNRKFTKKIQIKHMNFEKWPYLDTFRFMKSGELFAAHDFSDLQSGFYKILNRTDGTWMTASNR